MRTARIGKRRSNEGYSKSPDFFIVGAPKCGTTALYNYLQSHPQIFMPPEKEPHFFAQELSDFFVYTRSMQEYVDLFADAPENSLRGEASVLYLFSDTAVKKNTFGQSKC